MELSATQVAVVLVTCVAVIGGIFALYRRGTFGGAKVDDRAPAGSAKP